MSVVLNTESAVERGAVKSARTTKVKSHALDPYHFLVFLFLQYLDSIKY